MSYEKKSALVYTGALTTGTIAALAIAAIIPFILFGAYMPDGVSLTGYVYGLSDPEAITTLFAAACVMIGTTIILITAGENRIRRCFVNTVKEAPALLTVADRCDSCPAAAQVRVTLASGSELTFCGHHYAKNAAALQPLATEIYQNPEPDSAA